MPVCAAAQCEGAHGSSPPPHSSWYCLLAAIAGCRTHLSLRDNTVLTTETLTDLNYQQVLDNLARFMPIRPPCRRWRSSMLAR